MADYTGDRVCRRDAVRFLWSLDYHGFDIDRLATVPTESGLVDPRLCGIDTQYVNHSCSPNCALFEEGAGQHTFVFLKANMDLKSGSELSIDYGSRQAEVRRRCPIRCLCGAPNCRGILW